MGDVQQLAQQSSMSNLVVIITSYDLPQHDLGRHAQPSAALTTVLRVLQIKEQGQKGVTLFNTLLDQARIERLALVKVPSPFLPFGSSLPWKPETSSSASPSHAHEEPSDQGCRLPAVVHAVLPAGLHRIQHALHKEVSQVTARVPKTDLARAQSHTKNRHADVADPACRMRWRAWMLCDTIRGSSTRPGPQTAGMAMPRASLRPAYRATAADQMPVCRSKLSANCQHSVLSHWPIALHIMAAALLHAFVPRWVLACCVLAKRW